MFWNHKHKFNSLVRTIYGPIYKLDSHTSTQPWLHVYKCSCGLQRIIGNDLDKLSFDFSDKREFDKHKPKESSGDE